jgi:Ca-activated chloride channel family protein
MSFHQPSVWFLLLLAVLPVVWWRWHAAARRPAVRYSSTAPFGHLGPPWSVRLRWIVPALRLLGLALVIVALARPQKGDETRRTHTEGIAIQLVVDRSGSMRAQDFTINGKPADRLTIVKNVVRDFVNGEKDLQGRPDDMIGCIAFASFADSLCPLTTDHAHLIDALMQIRPANDRTESATAIGDAVALGVERLKSLEQRIAADGGPVIKGKVMILLTDGENNAGDIDPVTAAEMAAAFGIKIYAIGAGTTQGMAPLPDRDVFGRPLMMPVSIDEPTLRKMAEVSGGKYFRASDTESLRHIYAEIDRLERSKINERRYITYTQAAVEPVRLAGWTWPPVLLVALVVLGLETFLRYTRFRTVP